MVRAHLDLAAPYGKPAAVDAAEDDVWVNAVVIDVGPDGLARSIEQVLEPVPD